MDDDNPISELDLILLGGANYSTEGLTVTPYEDFYGTLQVGVKVTDQIATSDTYLATVIVNSVNDPPVITGQKSTLEAKQLITLEINVTDLYHSDKDNSINQLSVNIQPDPNSIYIANGNYLTVTADTTGPIDVVVTIDDGQDTSNEYTLEVNVLAAFNAPQFTTTPPTEAIAGKAYFYLVDAIDPDVEDQLTYSASTLPDWLNFNEDMKLLGGKPTLNDTGTVWVGIEVTDGVFVTEQLYQLEVRLYTSGDYATSIGGEQVSSGLIKSLYPVPAHEMIHLILENEGEVDIQIVDVSGKIMMQMRHYTDSRSDLEISLEGLNPGIYFIRVLSGESIDSRKFIIRQ